MCFTVDVMGLAADPVVGVKFRSPDSWMRKQRDINLQDAHHEALHSVAAVNPWASVLSHSVSTLVCICTRQSYASNQRQWRG